MELRKKPIPAPIARASTSRALMPAAFRRGVPTVAALLAITSTVACGRESHIEADHHVVEVVKYTPPAASVTATAATLPGMGALEVEATPPPPPPAPAPKPPMVKGGMKHVAPIPKTPKLSGDVAVVDPTI